ncbi:MAG: VanZ family protein [Chloroflexi bacterium]|nr:VanZ family protein [Chloroflexota bacterium]
MLYDTGMRWARAFPIVSALAWTGLIFYFSSRSEPPSAVPTTLFPGADKVAHLGEYAVWGFLAYRAALSMFRQGFSLRWVLLAGLVVAGADEAFQSLVPGRDASWADFLADGAGAMMGAAVGRAWWRRSSRPAV